MAILTAGEHAKVKKLITWAAIESTGLRMPKGEQLEAWKKKGVAYVKNARTGQDMPHYIQFYNDFANQKERFNIKNSIESLVIPILIFHGDNDESVNVEAAFSLHKWAKNSKIEIIKGANHSFGTKHPWNNDSLPEDMERVVDKSIAFIRE